MIADIHFPCRGCLLATLYLSHTVIKTKKVLFPTSKQKFHRSDMLKMLFSVQTRKGTGIAKGVFLHAVITFSLSNGTSLSPVKCGELEKTLTDNFVCTEFYGLVNTIRIMVSQSVNLLRFPGKA